MGTRNILVDDDFNFLAIIDWEFAQTAPWQVNHYPMPFPLLESEEETEEKVKDEQHIAHKNVLKMVAAQKLYRQKFLDAEAELARQGRPLARSIGNSLNEVAPRVFACLEQLHGDDDHDEHLLREMVRLAYDLDGRDITEFVGVMGSRMEVL